MKIRAKKDKWQSLLVKQIAIGLLAGFGSLFTPSAAYAVCVLEPDLELLHLGGRNMIVYWEENDCDASVEVMYQTSSDNGQTWNDADVLTSSNVLAVGGFVEQFDGILLVGKRGKLVASFAVFEGGDPKFKVVTSKNFGKDWGAPILAWNIADDIPGFTDFLDCPELESRSIPGSGVVSLLTAIVHNFGATATAWVVTSRDSGQTWGAAQELGDLPLECDDDDD